MVANNKKHKHYTYTNGEKNASLFKLFMHACMFL